MRCAYVASAFLLTLLFNINIVTGCRLALCASQYAACDAASLTLAEHGILRQAHRAPHAPQRDEQLAEPRFEVNQHSDGFGVGWFSAEGDAVVARTGSSVFTSGGADSSITADIAHGGKDSSTLAECIERHKQSPALDDAMCRISDAARVVLAGGANQSTRVAVSHVRAATLGELGEANSHPFRFSGPPGGHGPSVLFAHNGGIADCEARRPALMAALPPWLRTQLRGSTDSELAGAIFVSNLGDDPVEPKGYYGTDRMEAAMVATLQELAKPWCSTGTSGDCPPDCSRASSLNFVASDGDTVLATRFRSCEEQTPPVMYFAAGMQLDLTGGNLSSPQTVWPIPLGVDPLSAATVLVSSEPLWREKSQNDNLDPVQDGNPNLTWHLLLKDQMLTYTLSTGALWFRCVSPACYADHEFRSAALASTSLEAHNAHLSSPRPVQRVSPWAFVGVAAAIMLLWAGSMRLPAPPADEANINEHESKADRTSALRHPAKDARIGPGLRSSGLRKRMS